MQPAAPQARAGGSSAMYVAAGCGLILLLACCLGGAGLAIWQLLKSREAAATGTPGGVAGGSVIVSGVVESAAGLAGVVPGTPCSFTISLERSGQCRAPVVCGGTALYGRTTGSGYFPCTLTTTPASVRGSDESTSASDGDAAFSIDSAAGTFRVADDASSPLGAFTVTARISSVN